MNGSSFYVLIATSCPFSPKQAENFGNLEMPEPISRVDWEIAMESKVSPQLSTAL